LTFDDSLCYAVIKLAGHSY